MARNWRKAGGADMLGAAIGGSNADLLFGGDGEALRDTVALRLTDVIPNPDQPRRHFDAAELEGLAASLTAVGQLVPILVKRHPEEPRRYFLIAGERRWRAAGLAGLATVAAHILPDDCASEQIALIENLQRVNLSPIEEAEGLQRLVDRHGYSQEQAGGVLGRSRTEVNTTLSLLRLDPAIRRACVTSHTELSKALLLEIARMPAAEQLSVWAEVADGGGTVRQIRAVRRGAKPVSRGAGAVTAAERGVKRLSLAVDTVMALDEAEVAAIGRDRLIGLRERLLACLEWVDRSVDDEV